MKIRKYALMWYSTWTTAANARACFHTSRGRQNRCIALICRQCEILVRRAQVLRGTVTAAVVDLRAIHPDASAVSLAVICNLPPSPPVHPLTLSSLLPM